MVDEGKIAFRPAVELSSYSKDYFLDNSSYAANLQATLDDQYSHKRMLEERKETLKSDSAAIKEFSVYNEKWEAKTLSEIEKVKADIAEKQEQIQALETEQNLLKVHICENQEEEKRLTEDLRQICGQLALFERLIGKLEEENSLARDLEAAERKLRDLSYQQSQKDSDKTKEETELEAVLDKLKELETMEKTLHEGLSKVSDAAESEIINDDWTVLLSQYETLLSVQSADLKRLNEDKTRLLKESSEKQKEIQKRKCDQEEYEALIYSEELEVEADAERGNAEAVYQTADAACSKASRSQAKAESSFENAADKLKEFGAEALPLSEVGRGFDARILDINKKIADIENQSRIIAAVLAKLQKIQGKAETVTEQYQRPAKYTGLTLETDYAVQLESIIRQIREWKNSVEISERKVEDDLEKMSSVLHHGGEIYSFSPYSLVWDGDNYYVVGYSDKYKSIGSHRVDRIAQNPDILEESAAPQPVGFDVAKYIKTTFRMYNAPRVEVELLCDNSVMDAIIDRFGPNVHTYAGDLQNFRVIEEVAIGNVFFNWIFGFEGKVRIKGPESVKEQYRQMVLRAAELV